MADLPWLTIIGLGEDGPDGLPPASRSALEDAEVVMGPPRHLSLLSDLTAKRVEWPVPFADGVPKLLALRGRRVVVLVSGDPFWFGAGSVLARKLEAAEWRAMPGPSTFSLAAARLGWPLESTACFGLHAAPLARLRPHLAPGLRAIVLLRDGTAVGSLAEYIAGEGFGNSRFTVMEALGGPRENLRQIGIAEAGEEEFAHPVCVGVEVAGDGAVMTHASGLRDDWFESDGQITKRPMRALTLSALAPKPFEHLWDIGGGSGSVAIEWLLSHPTLTAVSVEPREERAKRIRVNADRLGVDRLDVVTGAAPAALEGLVEPQAVFIGGGLDSGLLDRLTGTLRKGTRIVANAVTLETETLLAQAQADHGGDLLRIELAEAAPLGSRRAWKAAYPVVQWSVTL